MNNARTGCVVCAVLVLVGSIGIIIAGAIIASENAPFRSYWSELFSLPIYAAVVGAFAFMFSIGLFYITMKQFPALTTIISIGLIIIGIFAFVSGVLAVRGGAHIREETYNITNYLMHNFYNLNYTNERQIYAQLQQRYKCCGVINPHDWAYVGPNVTSVPDSCCIEMSPNCGYNQLVLLNRTYIRGCGETLSHIYSIQYVVFIALSFFIMVACIAGGVAGSLFAKRIRQQYEVM
ncbi:unnamed protein product [Didymodactylos carnosus]|uniref:Tetraspanin n=1 Tax=Didymodactylos carnosus TaxID=1234261 RepID=A0A816BK61_9BILA|nr:unnamed protein product [Didymodactylos carnosus]CAF1608736.1 unnamed protein product [Didymodactylos carnosus]CAF4231130.1 unnamed protein product [Didymodactylos carnosus]CAF4490363.1 unnamed protein product [Didymodactylos carnosus]